MGGVSCRNPYRSTKAVYSSDPCHRLKLRITEAQQAEETTERAATTLRDRLNKALARDAVEPDVDRLEMTALDLRRSILSAQDAAAACEQVGTYATELERLDERASEMLDAVQLIRSQDSTTTLTQINALLRE